MKIAHIICTFPPYKGGMGNSAYHFVRILSQMGHEVVVFTPDYGYKEENGEREEKFKVVRLKSLIKIGNAAVLPQFLWKLKNFDVVHLHYPFYGATEFVILAKILFWKRIKLVVHYHMDTVGCGIKGLIFKMNRIFILPIILRLSKIITCASLDYIKHSDIAKYYLKNEKKFKQVPFGVDINHFVPQKNPTEKQKIILFVGGLDKAHYFKGLENLFKAFEKVVGKVKDVKLIIVGDGNMKEYYMNMANELGIKERVEFTGTISYEKLPHYYQNSSIFVLPSLNKSEAFGLVLLEAMACGVPVITTNLPGVRSVLKNAKQGFIVQPNDASDLARKIMKLLNDKKLANKMGQAGRKLVEKEYTWEEAGKNLDYIYHRIKYSPK